MSRRYRITTVMGLPGAGKSTYCRERAPKGIGQGEGCWRPEPTEDIEWLKAKMDYGSAQYIIAGRLAAQDSVVNPAQYRDSDTWTNHYIFGTTSYIEAKVYFPEVSDNLVWLKISPELQRERIIHRARPSWEKELLFTSEFWHETVTFAYENHPAKNKEIINVS
jgi:hypothetical protein